MNNFSNNIKKKRIEEKLSQNELAKKIGITQPYLAQIECGKKTPSLNIASKICSELDISFMEDETNIFNENTNILNNFKDANEAMSFIIKQPALMAFGGYDIKEMSDDEICALAQLLLDQLNFTIKTKK